LRLLYDALPAGDRKLLAGLTATHHWSKSLNPRFAGALDEAAQEEGTRIAAMIPQAHQPLVRTHPETGRRALYLSPRFTLRIDAAAPDASDAILNELFALMDDPRFCYRHQWRERDLMIWDNRCLNRFWHFDVRLWRPVTYDWVSGKVLEIIQANPIKGQRSASLIGQTMTLLKAKLAVKDDVLSFVAEPRPIINCQNGELWIAADGSVELRPHRPDSYLRDCLNVVYDPAAKCPEYDKAVLEIFGKVKKPKRMVRHWNELVGYIIQPGRNIPIIVVLLGGGDNGKTVLMRAVTGLLGDQLVHAQRVEDLDKSRFAMGSLLGKRLYVDDDVKAGARLPDGTLKTISEAKVVTGELKFKQSFNFVVRTIPALLCNNIPSLGDLSHGMQRRLMVVPFDRRFTGKDKDPNLFDRILANEMSGVKEHRLVVEEQEPFAAVILCTADPDKVDYRMRSKWSRVLRYAAEFKGLEEPLSAFIKRKGGINKCASRFARHLGRGSPHSSRSIHFAEFGCPRRW